MRQFEWEMKEQELRCYISEAERLNDYLEFAIKHLSYRPEWDGRDEVILVFQKALDCAEIYLERCEEEHEKILKTPYTTPEQELHEFVQQLRKKIIKSKKGE